jgi:CHAD domain-containing protein/uncharacterized protein YjbK
MSGASRDVEIELKLVLPGSKAEGTVIDFLRQRSYGIEPVDTTENVDIYMDTSDWTLLKNKLSLRYRVSDGKAMYTMKSVGTIENGIAKRMEDEVTLPQPAHSPTDIPVKTLRKWIDDFIYPRKLMEQILIRTIRRRYQVTSRDGTKLELAFDNSSFSADALLKPRRATRLYELEAELIEGPERSLKSLASLLSGTFGYPPSRTSKMETAMTRLKVEPLVKKVPEELKVKINDHLDQALKKILAVEFHWFLEQLPGIVSDRDPEFVHQARVSTRRMRSALILFHDALPVKMITYLEQRLKWLGKLYGAVRDLDVFIINLTNYQDRLESCSEAKKRALETLVVKQRRAPLKVLNAALLSRRFKTFERRMARLLEAPSSEKTEVRMAATPLYEVAPQIIIPKLEAVIEQGRKALENPKLSEFHCLRIQMKRLRYAFEFMATPYGNVFKDIIRRTVEIQDCLGELQDTVFNQGFIKRILKEWQGKLVDPDLIFIMGEIYQFQGNIIQERQKTFYEMWERFNPEQTAVLLKRIFQEQSAKIKNGV